jgi:hypothetical protein
MQTIKKLYRNTYLGEDVIRDLVWENGRWNYSSEYVPNNLINNQTSDVAVIFGNGPSRLQLHPNLFTLIKNHKNGIFANNALQTYGCNALHRDFQPDFLVATGEEVVAELVDIGYWFNHIVYSTQDAVLNYPGKFYLTPQNPLWNAGSIAAYLAAFDGHKKIYLMGFDNHENQATQDKTNVYIGTRGYQGPLDPTTELFFTNSLLHIMQVYTDVEFVRVMPVNTYEIPESWKYQTNFRQIDFFTFIREVDL